MDPLLEHACPSDAGRGRMDGCLGRGRCCNQPIVSSLSMSPCDRRSKQERRRPSNRQGPPPWPSVIEPPRNPNWSGVPARPRRSASLRRVVSPLCTTALRSSSPSARERGRPREARPSEPPVRSGIGRGVAAVGGVRLKISEPCQRQRQRQRERVGGAGSGRTPLWGSVFRESSERECMSGESERRRRTVSGPTPRKAAQR